ncbi:MAG: hypothetical protein R3E42_01085 [Burkholderiaceae bacterium]
MAVEAFYGWKIDSLALLADAGHNLSDVAGLALAWGWRCRGTPEPRRLATPTAGSAAPSWPPLPTPCSCSWPWVRWCGKPRND